MTEEKINGTVNELFAAAATLNESSEWILIASEDEIRSLLDRIACEIAANKLPPEPKWMDIVGAKLVQRAERNRTSFEEMTIEKIHKAYCSIPPKDPARRFLLRMLSEIRRSPEMQCFADLIAQSPPVDPRVALDGFAPLFQFQETENETLDVAQEAYAALFPRLLDALQHIQVAAIVLDLANHLTKQGLLASHPLSLRRVEITQLLGGIVQQLARIAEKPAQGLQASAQITESVALAISLCQTMALTQATESIPKLHQMVGLSHRRCQIEAAYALAALNDDAGKIKLIELADDPSTRLRALAYAEELQMLDQIPRRRRTPISRAEAELVTWLCEPTRFGLPPTECELEAQQCFFWPGYDEPVDCYLFRYSYRMPDGEHCNCGISGPLTLAFAEDLTCLDTQDVFALFAGWQAEHAEITQTMFQDWNDSQQQQAAELMQQLESTRYSQITPQLLGQFFGEPVLICSAETDAIMDREPEVGHLLVDSNGFAWLKHEATQLPINAVQAWSVFKGRKLLQTFNPPVHDHEQL